MKKQYFTLRIKRPSISFQFHYRALRWFIILLFVLLLAFFISAAFGEMRVKPLNVIQALLGKGAAEDVMVVHTLRLPRMIVAFLVGASLAVSGAILQGVIRNPLAAPDIIGVTGGASVAAVAFVMYMPSTVSIHWLPVAAMVGALVVSMIIYGLAWNGGIQPIRLVLVGIGIASFMSACTTFMIVFSPTYTASSAYIWLTGTVYGSSWKHVWTLLPWTILFMALAVLHIRHLNVQLLGDDIAKGAGSHVQRHRLLLLLISVVLAGSAVSMGGVIGFVGLIAPHMARRMIGPAFGGVIPITALLGGIIVVIADLIARTAFLPLDIPVGVFTSGIGAPFFIYLLYRTRNVR